MEGKASGMEEVHSGSSGAASATGWALFRQQTQALLLKNALLAWRNKAATFLQLFSSFFFIVLVFAINKAVLASLSGLTTFQNVFTPTPQPVLPIPSCTTGYYLAQDCYDFVWSGNWSATVVSLVNNISANNPGRPINPQTQTLGFATPADVNVWLLANPFRTPAALLFDFTSQGTLGYGIQTNSTAKQQRGIYEDPTFTFQVPLQAAAERELARHATQNFAIGWTPSYSEFPHPATDILNVVAQTLAVFLFAAAMFNFVIQTSNVVMEKETKVRQAMSTMGLLDSVYWLTWTLWEVGLAVVSCLLLMCFGLMFQFDFFLRNGFFTLFFLFFFFWVCMTSVAFLISVFLRKSSAANTVGFSFFIVGFILQLVVVFGFPYDKQFAGFWRVIFSLFPPNLLAIGLKYLGDATATPQDPGISLANAAQCAPRNPDCVLTVAGVYAWLLALSLVYLLLAVYLDNVVPDVNGVRKPVFFFLSPSFWTGKASSKARNARASERLLSAGGGEEGVDIDADVAAEEKRVREASELHSGAEEEDAAVALSVRGLQKVFEGKRPCCGLCGKKKADFHAVKGSWFDLEKETLLCLLGPNGAGKSTTINCLTGIIPTSAGDALIYGRSIRSPSSMSVIRRTMGVCPQFDVLWDRLSGREHLYLFARIKGLDTHHIPKEVEALLGEVRLTEAGATRTGSYSGGMKRRLSVAVALIGNPSIVFLDEPTTGMDPVSRRYVWDIIERAKRGRAIVLTTHSMEEADILGDRIAIMAKGRLRCIGTSIHLKQRFGAGIIVTVGFERGLRVPSLAQLAPEGGEEPTNGQTNGGTNGALAVPKGGAATEAALAQSRERVKGLFMERLGVAPESESKSYLRFSIPRNLEPEAGDAQEEANGAQAANGGEDADARLTAFFRELKDRQKELGVTDVQLSLTTLEEVFLNIAKMAELETAAVEGRFDTLVLPAGLTVKVPVGAERVVFTPAAKKHRRGAGPGEAPRRYVMHVEWQQDEAGNLRIFRHSDPVVLGQEGEEGEGMGEEEGGGAKGWCACCGPKAEVVTAEEVGTG